MMRMGGKKGKGREREGKGKGGPVNLKCPVHVLDVLVDLAVDSKP